MAGVCKYYSKGQCKYGDRCKYQHPINQQQNRTDGRNVCKFFLEGKCKYGDKCRSYHPKQDHYGGQRSGRYQDPPIDTGRNWNQRGQGGRSGFELYTHQDAVDGGGYQRDGGRHHQEDRGYRGGQRRDYQQDHQRESWDRRGDHNQRNSQYRWQSPDYRQQSHAYRGWEDRREGQGHGPATERRRLFSQGDDKIPHQPTDTSEIAAIIRRDVESSRSMWPLSCYSYHKDVSCVPGLAEVSPEELRWLGYMAKSSGNDVAFLQNLEEVKKKQVALQDLYANITTEEASKLLSLPPQSPSADWTTGLFGPISTTNIDAAISSLFGTRTTAPLLLGGANPPLFQDLNMSTQASSIFPPAPVSLPAGQVAANPLQVTAKPVQVMTSPHTASVTVPRATPAAQEQATSKLTQEDLEAFKADKFVLGEIPETAPPPDLC